MQANHDGMGHVGPIHGVCHADVVASAVVVLAGAIDGGAIVACATKHVVVAHVVAGKDIHAIAPPIPTDDLGVAHADTLASAHRNLRGDGAVDHHVGRIPDHDALMLALGIDNAVTDDLGVGCLPYRGEALDVSAAGYIEHLVAAHTNGVVAQVVIAGTIKQHVFFLHPQGLGHLPGVLVDGDGGVGEELQVMVGVAVDLHREVERTVEREANGVAVEGRSDVFRQRTDASGLHVALVPRYFHLDLVGEIEVGHRRFLDGVATVVGVVYVPCVGVDRLPEATRCPDAHREVVVQGRTRWGGVSGYGAGKERQRHQLQEKEGEQAVFHVLSDDVFFAIVNDEALVVSSHALPLDVVALVV